MIKKILSALILFLLFSWSVIAITPQEIQEQIKYALEIVRQTELKLKQLNPILTTVWITEKTNEQGHAAEVELRRLYPKEYTEYLEARSNLDSLLYTQYLMFANGKAE